MEAIRTELGNGNLVNMETVRKQQEKKRNNP